MHHKPLDQITAQDITDLVDNESSESRHLEFKSALPGRAMGDKKEFLADVSAFANADGGLLLYGVHEANGKASTAPGLVNINADEEMLRLTSMINDGLDPRIPGCQVHAIEGFDQGPVIAIRVPRSWISPHMVTLDGSSRFYVRRGASKHQMDVTELRTAFESLGNQSKQIRQWRDDRIGKIIGGCAPIPLESPNCLVLHVVPLESIMNEPRLDAAELAKQRINLIPFAGEGDYHRINLDGLLTYDPLPDGECLAYAQLFGSGRIETVLTGISELRDGSAYISLNSIEHELFDTIRRYMGILSALNVYPPILIALALCGVRGALPQTRRPIPRRYAIDRDNVFCHDVVIDSDNSDLPQALKPLIDSMWNACGVPSSPNYNNAGEWGPGT